MLGVRVPPGVPAQKFPAPRPFRLWRKLRYAGNFFASNRDPLRWARGWGRPVGGCFMSRARYLFYQREVRRSALITPLLLSPRKREDAFARAPFWRILRWWLCHMEPKIRLIGSNYELFKRIFVEWSHQGQRMSRPRKADGPPSANTPAHTINNMEGS